MTYHFTDEHGDSLEVLPAHCHGSSAIHLYAVQSHESTTITVPVDRVEELIAGLRDTARQTAARREGAAT
jgi:hypothetical protein